MCHQGIAKSCSTIFSSKLEIAWTNRTILLIPEVQNYQDIQLYQEIEPDQTILYKYVVALFMRTLCCRRHSAQIKTFLFASFMAAIALFYIRGKSPGRGSFALCRRKRALENIIKMCAGVLRFSTLGCYSKETALFG